MPSNDIRIANLSDDERELATKRTFASFGSTHAADAPAAAFGTTLKLGTIPSTDEAHPGGLTPKKIKPVTPADSGTSGVGVYKSGYEFYETMSEELLHKYLDRAIQINALSHNPYSTWHPESPGPSIAPGYDPDSNVPPLYNPAYENGKLLRMILNTGAKFIFDTVSYKGKNTTKHDLEFIVKTLRNNCRYLHAADPDIIVGVTLHETIPLVKQASNLLVPTDPAMIAMFYGPGGRPATYGPYFNFEQMIVGTVAEADGWNNASHLNLARAEAHLYYYYLATRYIDAGCEAIHFGDLFVGGNAGRDKGNRKLWNLVTAIRNYAKLHARRKLVLIDAHVGGYASYDKRNGFGWRLYDEDDDIIRNPKKDWELPLIFDFHSLGMFYDRNTGRGIACYDDPNSHILAASSLPVRLPAFNGLLNHSDGGWHPLGWLCSHAPSLCRFDIGFNNDVDGDKSPDINSVGCAYPDPGPGAGSMPWGWDNTSWFVRQSTFTKQAILKYNYYKIKCADPYSHFCMPGRLIIRKKYNDIFEDYYNAFAEEAIIKEIWSGAYAGPNDWSPHNFTLQNVANPDVAPASGLIRVGTDKMYFIGTDGYIHGYIYNNNVYNGGVWLTVSPSYAAQFSGGPMVAHQVKAQSDLVASPNGDRLLYIGVDGYIYGYHIYGHWEYGYFKFMQHDMSLQYIRAVGSLIYPAHDKIYYIAKYFGSPRTEKHDNRVHGFQRSSGIWQTVSPTYAAEFNHSQNLNTQKKAIGALTYVRQAPYDRIYYRDIEGLLSYYDVRSHTDYQWHECPVNTMLRHQQLTIVGNLAVHQSTSETLFYYVGRWAGDGSMYIHVIVNAGTSWGTNSPSYAAHSYATPSIPATPIGTQLQSAPAGNIAVSPNGETIIYFPHFPASAPGAPYPYLCCYNKVGSIYYTYQCFQQQVAQKMEAVASGNSLIFANNAEFFFISRQEFHKTSVQRFKFQECFCTNEAIGNYE